MNSFNIPFKFTHFLLKMITHNLLYYMYHEFGRKLNSSSNGMIFNPLHAIWVSIQCRNTHNEVRNKRQAQAYIFFFTYNYENDISLHFQFQNYFCFFIFERPELFVDLCSKTSHRSKILVLTVDGAASNTWLISVLTVLCWLKSNYPKQRNIIKQCDEI